MERLADLAAILVPVYVCVAGGLLWARMGRPINLSFVAGFAYVVGAPPLVFAVLKKAPAGSVPIGALIGAALLALALGALIAVAASLSFKRRLDPAVLAVAVPFSGAVALAALRYGWGEAGFVQGVVYFAVATIVLATVGRAAAHGHWTARALFGSPIGWVMAAAFLAALVPWTPPKFLLNTTTLLGGLLVPVMLVASGVALGRARAAAFVRALPVGVARLAIGLVAGVAAASALGLDGTPRAVVVLESATPIAFLWPIYARTGWDEFAAALAVGLAALPVLVAVLI
jgi:predicted permease